MVIVLICCASFWGSPCLWASWEPPCWDCLTTDVLLRRHSHRNNQAGQHARSCWQFRLFTFAGYLLAQGGDIHPTGKIFQKSSSGGSPVDSGWWPWFPVPFSPPSPVPPASPLLPWGGFSFRRSSRTITAKDFSLGLMTTSGSLGLHFPPSLPIILYGFVSGTSIEELFMAGLLPGTLMVGILCLFSVYMGS